MTSTRKLLEVFRYWRVLSRKWECPELLFISLVNRKAVIDYLIDSEKITNDHHISGSISPRQRASAYEWLFGDLGCEGDLAYLCQLVGPRVHIVRTLIVEAALERGQILMWDACRVGEEKLDCIRERSSN